MYPIFHRIHLLSRRLLPYSSTSNRWHDIGKMRCIWLKQLNHTPDFGQTGEKGQKHSKDNPFLLLKRKNTLQDVKHWSNLLVGIDWTNAVETKTPSSNTCIWHWHLNKPQLKKPPVHNFGRSMLMDIQPLGQNPFSCLNDLLFTSHTAEEQKSPAASAEYYLELEPHWSRWRPQGHSKYLQTVHSATERFIPLFNCRF